MGIDGKNHLMSSVIKNNFFHRMRINGRRKGMNRVTEKKRDMPFDIKTLVRHYDMSCEVEILR